MNRATRVSVVACASAVLTACGASSVTEASNVVKPVTVCSPAAHHAAIVLRYQSPIPRITVAAGTLFVVSVPPWSSGHATEISTHSRGAVRQVCSIGLNDGGRWAEFQAMKPGRSSFSAGVTPASNVDMPIWQGYATVTRQS